MNVWVDIRPEIALIWSLVELEYANMASYLEGSKVNWVIRTTQGVGNEVIEGWSTNAGDNSNPVCCGLWRGASCAYPSTN